MRERGQYQIQLMKTRSSSGVGQKVELAFDIETLRITDPGTNAPTHNSSQPSAQSIMDKFKTTSQVGLTDQIVDEQVDTEQKKVNGDVQSTKLKSLLNTLKDK